MLINSLALSFSLVPGIMAAVCTRTQFPYAESVGIEIPILHSLVYYDNVNLAPIADGIITVVDGCSFRVQNFNFRPDGLGTPLDFVFTWYGLNSATGDEFRLIYKNVGASSNTDNTYTFLDLDGISFEEFDSFVLFSKQSDIKDIKVAYAKLPGADEGGKRETTMATTTTTTGTTSSTSAAQTDSTVEDSNAQSAGLPGADEGGNRETTKATTTTTTGTTSSTSAAQTDSTVEDSNAQVAQAAGAHMASFSLLAIAVLSLSLFMVV
jgi:hypothetical protein